MSILIFIINLFGLFLYIKIANKLNIVDKPNFRSSHTLKTVRGGGIVFPISFLISRYLSVGFDIVFFSIFMISIISFIDDIKNLSSILRLLFHILSVLGIYFSLNNGVLSLELFIYIIVFVYAINMYNFMDGINGLTPLYSLIFFLSAYYLFKCEFYNLNMLPTIENIILSIIAFSIYNFRKNAKCFSGDVGSISLAAIICYFLFIMIRDTKFFYWIVFLGIYFFDTAFTIICRFFRNESILTPHRSHFYQFLVNEYKFSHLQVAFLYATCQLGLNFIVIYAYKENNVFIILITMFFLVFIYLMARIKLEGVYRLFIKY